MGLKFPKVVLFVISVSGKRLSFGGYGSLGKYNRILNETKAQEPNTISESSPKYQESSLLPSKNSTLSNKPLPPPSTPYTQSCNYFWRLITSRPSYTSAHTKSKTSVGFLASDSFIQIHIHHPQHISAHK
jgi:hypothetical protein